VTAPRTWNDIRAAANRFVTDWQGESRERAEKDTFWNEFFAIFGVTRRRVAVFEQLADRVSTGRHGFLDCFWPGHIGVEHKSRGEDLDAAMDQLLDYLPGLPDGQLPRLAVVCDFARFKVHDLDTNEHVAFALEELPNHLELFGFIAGYDRQSHYATEEDVNLKATALLADLHDALKDSGYTGHDLRVFLVRVLFVLFADDTGVWERGLFHDYVALKTSDDGRDLGSALTYLFQVLDTPRATRPSTLDEDLAAFTYVNGGLFQETLRAPACDRAMRDRLLAASKFDWSKISPAIFGSLFQNVMEPAERRNLGAHYTTEQNILRTIEPLFLDELRADLAAADSLPKLRAFRDRLATLTFFDPACGCGNFLVIAYREIRRLERDCLLRIRETEAGRRGRRAAGSGQLSVEATLESKVGVGQFYGIEIEEFPARIAETAMHLMDHLANMELSVAFGEYYARFPIEDTAHVLVGNALREDWSGVLAPDDCTYLFGNPPFVGRQHRTEEQTDDQRLAMGEHYNGYLDYVTAWHSLASRYMRNTSVRAAFVSTNSIVQGEQVGPLWQPLLDSGLEIDFAHRTFAWTSEARGRAAVHVVIVGFSPRREGKSKVIFDYLSVRADPVAKSAKNINPYLADAPDVIVTPLAQPLVAGVPRAAQGSKPTDGGGLLVTPEQVDDVRADPVAAKYLRVAMGARQLLHDEDRWCLWLYGADPGDVRRSRVLQQRLQVVKSAREDSRNARTRSLARTPGAFDVNAQPTGDYLCIPRHSSENRRLVPMKLLTSDVIVMDSAMSVGGADLWLFGVLQSAMFDAWVRAVAGRLKSDMRIAPDLVYNTFPFPEPQGAYRQRIEIAAQAVLDERAAYPESSLADLYHPTSTATTLLQAHDVLDKAVDAAIAGPRRRFASLADRQAVLFERYLALREDATLI
jgi:hypothetical protein